MTQKNPSPEEQRKATVKAVARYGGLAFELLCACLAGVFIGRWVDEKIGLEKPAFAVFLTIAFLFASLYRIYKQLLKD